jgi:hypothetical protein
VKGYHMDPKNGAAGFAALAISESLLLSLSDNKVLAVEEARAVLKDAATASREAGNLAPDGAAHTAAAAIIDTILAGRNSVRIE